MQPTKTVFALAFSLLILGCGQKRNGQMEMEATADAVSSSMTSGDSKDAASAPVSSSAAVETGKDSTRKFIRTAELKFKVKSVIKSTYDIENITGRQGGFVTYTNLKSDINREVTTAVSADSSLETIYYTVTNAITLRVPNTRLDTTLKEIAANIDYLDYRIIKADDVALQITANGMAQKRAATSEQRITNAIDNRGRKLEETTTAEETVLNRQEQQDNAQLSNLSLKDQISFSTVNLEIYQRQTLRRELIGNDKNIDAYEMGFGAKIWEALKGGWRILEDFVVFLVSIWGLLLVAGVLYFVWRKWKKRLP
jgi:hypothetical protein